MLFSSSVHITLGSSCRCRIVSPLPSPTAKRPRSDLNGDLTRRHGDRSDVKGTYETSLLLKKKGKLEENANIQKHLKNKSPCSPFCNSIHFKNNLESRGRTFITYLLRRTLVNVIPALRSQRKDCHNIKTNLYYMESPKAAWATRQSLVSEDGKEKERESQRQTETEIETGTDRGNVSWAWGLVLSGRHSWRKTLQC